MASHVPPIAAVDSKDTADAAGAPYADAPDAADGPRVWFASQLRELYPAVTAWGVRPKVCGRHEGCVLASPDGAQLVFVKRQPLCLRTMLVYRILARVGCGPAHTLFRAVPACGGGDGDTPFDCDVATSGVPGFQMQSACGKPPRGDDAGTSGASGESSDTDDESGESGESSESSAPPQPAAGLDVADAVALVLLVCCLELADIPSNKDNWGTRSPGDDGGDHRRRRLAIVDFSFGVPHTMTSLLVLSVRERLLAAAQQWTAATVVHDGATQAAFAGAHGACLGGVDAFGRVVAAAMDDVCAWVNDDVRQRDWRRSLSLADNMRLLDQLYAFQDGALRRYRLFADWWFPRPSADAAAARAAC